MSRPVVALVTQSVVSLDDPAFAEPTKPIGPFLSEAQARSMAQKLGWSIMEDAGRGWRRTVASPRPLNVLETEAIRTLLDKGTVVVAAGGGGIPVAVEPDGSSRRCGSRGRQRSGFSPPGPRPGAEMLLVPTGVSKVAISFGTPQQRWLDTITVDEARAYIKAGEFGAGSMEPKVAAVAEFVATTPGALGVIGAPHEIRALIEGRLGTRIVPGQEGSFLFAVNGTLMRGFKLNPNMIAAKATFVRETMTEPGIPSLDHQRPLSCDDPRDGRKRRQDSCRNLVRAGD